MGTINNKKKMNLSDKAYKYMKEKIVLGEIRDGEIITEKSVGDLLNMSRTPVKKALVQLEHENYVKCIDGVGTIVVGLSIKDLADIYEVRKTLEILALKSSINKISESEINTIEKSLKNILYKKEKGIGIVSQDLVKIDSALHDLIIKNSTNNYIKKLMKYIESQIERYKYGAYSLTDTICESVEQHVEILNYIKDRDYENASNSLGNHITWSFEVLSKALSNIDI